MNIPKKWKITAGVALGLSWLILTFSSYGILAYASFSEQDKAYHSNGCMYFTGVTFVEVRFSRSSVKIDGHIMTYVSPPMKSLYVCPRTYYFGQSK